MRKAKRWNGSSQVIQTAATFYISLEALAVLAHLEIGIKLLSYIVRLSNSILPVGKFATSLQTRIFDSKLDREARRGEGDKQTALRQ